MQNLKKSEILFLYEGSYNVPNGDPFTGEQRYDEETKKILVSDVRMKRFVRDYLDMKEQSIYVKGKDNIVSDQNDDQEKDNSEDQENSKKKEGSGSARRIGELVTLFKSDIDVEKKKLNKGEKFSPALFAMKKCIDVRLFGGIATGKGDAVNLTGPVQFALLNPSFNEVNLRMHQNTSTFESKETNKQGAIATTTLVPYSIIQIHGWFNPKVAEKAGTTSEDLKLMFEALWYGTSGDGSSHSRSKVGQNSVLLLEIVYAENNKKIYGLDRLIQLIPKDDKKGEQLRSIDDYELNFTKLIEAANTDKVFAVNYYTEIDEIKIKFQRIPKFKALSI